LTIDNFNLKIISISTLTKSVIYTQLGLIFQCHIVDILIPSLKAMESV